MKFKPGTKVVITEVPLTAARMGVVAGMPATVLEIPEYFNAKTIEDLGMTIINIPVIGIMGKGADFFWSEDDLRLHQ